jgi:hypothetical protein
MRGIWQMRGKFWRNWTLCGRKCGTHKLPWLRVKPLGLLLPAILSGCQTTPSDEIELGAGKATFCQAARAIYYSRHDTSLTIAQIREHNAVGVALKCGWTPAKKGP